MKIIFILSLVVKNCLFCISIGYISISNLCLVFLMVQLVINRLLFSLIICYNEVELFHIRHEIFLMQVLVMNLHRMEVLVHIFRIILHLTTIYRFLMNIICFNKFMETCNKEFLQQFLFFIKSFAKV